MISFFEDSWLKKSMFSKYNENADSGISWLGHRAWEPWKLRKHNVLHYFPQFPWFLLPQKSWNITITQRFISILQNYGVPFGILSELAAFSSKNEAL